MVFFFLQIHILDGYRCGREIMDVWICNFFIFYFVDLHWSIIFYVNVLQIELIKSFSCPFLPHPDEKRIKRFWKQPGITWRWIRQKKRKGLNYPPYKVSGIWFSFMGFPNLILINMLKCCIIFCVNVLQIELIKSFSCPFLPHPDEKRIKRFWKQPGISWRWMRQKKRKGLNYPPYKVSGIWFSFMGFPNLIMMNMLKCCFLKNIWLLFISSLYFSVSFCSV